jgi:hypothetical protein
MGGLLEGVTIAGSYMVEDYKECNKVTAENKQSDLAGEVIGYERPSKLKRSATFSHLAEALSDFQPLASSTLGRPRRSAGVLPS